MIVANICCATHITDYADVPWSKHGILYYVDVECSSTMEIHTYCVETNINEFQEHPPMKEVAKHLIIYIYTKIHIQQLSASFSIFQHLSAPTGPGVRPLRGCICWE